MVQNNQDMVHIIGRSGSKHSVAKEASPLPGEGFAQKYYAGGATLTHENSSNGVRRSIFQQPLKN
jgi:hypothetical protein